MSEATSVPDTEDGHVLVDSVRPSPSSLCSDPRAGSSSAPAADTPTTGALTDGAARAALEGRGICEGITGSPCASKTKGVLQGSAMLARWSAPFFGEDTFGSAGAVWAPRSMRDFGVRHTPCSSPSRTALERRGPTEAAFLAGAAFKELAAVETLPVVALPVGVLAPSACLPAVATKFMTRKGFTAPLLSLPSHTSASWSNSTNSTE
mmetsp:Transcript_115028/g.330468  ORF Transcript_115028/g.330468 Transcript_115028/m.330468 type:complete len:207 (+) Transcript_115028:813-1433(+)